MFKISRETYKKPSVPDFNMTGCARQVVSIWQSIPVATRESRRVSSKVLPDGDIEFKAVYFIEKH